MKNEKPIESARRQAQDMAYKAMQTRDPEEAVRLCTRAIEIDPRCVDALVIMAGVFDNLDERACHLSHVVQIAKEDLGGERYMEENKGHFWGIVEFTSIISAPPSAPISTLFGMLVNAIGEDGLKLTATGNLPLKLVRDAALTFWGEDRYQENTRFGNIRCEHDFYELHVTRIVAGLAGLIRKYKGKFILSSKCRNLLKYGGMQAAYPLLLRTHAERFNWGYVDRYPETGLIQSFFAYTLYLLDLYGSEWRENTFYGDAFLRAFPSIVHGVEPTTYQTREDIVRGMYSLRCLQRFAEFLGLIEIDRKSEDQFTRIFKLRKTPLLGDAVRFHT